MTVRPFQVVRCTRCGHQWDDYDPAGVVCACIDTYGSRTVEVLFEGVTNQPTVWRLACA
jgi:hypothetical protein